MSNRFAAVTLGGVEYVVQPFNIGQMRRISKAFKEQPLEEVGYTMLQIALERAEPKCEDFDAIVASPPEINKALEVVTKLSGMDVPNPLEPVAPAGGDLSTTNSGKTSTAH